MARELAFETQRVHGVLLRAFYVTDDDGKSNKNADIEVDRAGEVIHVFQYPAYRIWNLAAHVEDIVGDNPNWTGGPMPSLTPEERERLRGLIVGWQHNANAEQRFAESHRFVGRIDRAVGHEELSAGYRLDALALQHALEEIDGMRETVKQYAAIATTLRAGLLSRCVEHCRLAAHDHQVNAASCYAAEREARDDAEALRKIDAALKEIR